MTGKGRGRGWLNIDKTTQSENGPGRISHAEKPQPPEINNVSKETMHYDKFFHAVSQFSSNDDGILLNQKFQYFEQLLKDECHSVEDVTDVIQYIYDMALADSSFTENFIIFVSLNTFRELRMYEHSVRNMFLCSAQQSYKDINQLVEGDRQHFRNCVKIIIGFYERAQIFPNKNYHMLLPAIKQYFLKLLDSNDPADIKFFVTMLDILGPKIAAESLFFSDIYIKIRMVLISNGNLTEEAKLYLLMAIDLSHAKFKMNDWDLIEFYETTLGRDDLFKDKVKCNSGTRPYRWEYVLENRTGMQPEDNVSITKTLNSDKNDSYGNGNKMPTNTYNQSQQSVSAGRPILGAGARTGAAKPDDATSPTGHKHLKGKSPNAPEKNGRKPRKGWEHDDRFETKYN